MSKIGRKHGHKSRHNLKHSVTKCSKKNNAKIWIQYCSLLKKRKNSFFKKSFRGFNLDIYKCPNFISLFTFGKKNVENRLLA